MGRYINFIILTAIATTLVFVGAALALTVQPAKAQTLAESGASSLAPGTNQKFPGDAKNVAPGQEAQLGGVFCQGCAKDFSPGQEGLTAGIIGPELKK